MAAGMFQGLQDAAAMKKRFERFGAVFFVAKVKMLVFLDMERKRYLFECRLL